MNHRTQQYLFSRYRSALAFQVNKNRLSQLMLVTFPMSANGDYRFVNNNRRAFMREDKKKFSQKVSTVWKVNRAHKVVHVRKWVQSSVEVNFRFATKCLRFHLSLSYILVVFVLLDSFKVMGLGRVIHKLLEKSSSCSRYAGICHLQLCQISVVDEVHDAHYSNEPCSKQYMIEVDKLEICCWWVVARS